MKPQLDLNKTVFELSETYENFVDIMADLGFPEIKNPALRATAGRVTTPIMGAKVKGIDLDKMVKAFESAGFELVGLPEAPVESSSPEPACVEHSASEDSLGSLQSSATPSALVSVGDGASSRVEQVKSYLKRLGKGEDLALVRQDFARDFEDVSATEIMEAEQALMAEGTPIEEIKQLCDIHSALFHGMTCSEHSEGLIADMEARAAALTSQLSAASTTSSSDKAVDSASSGSGVVFSSDLPAAHPLRTFHAENQALGKLLEAIDLNSACESELVELLPKLCQISVHYAKKGDLLYPLLETNYNISGPSKVMWTVDDEIRHELSALIKQTEYNSSWTQRTLAVIQRIKEMIYKEENILLPLCLSNFSSDEWKQIYRDSADYAECFCVKRLDWPEAMDESSTPNLSALGEKIQLAGGELSPVQISAMFDAMPVEITFVDDQNINRFFNNSSAPKDFKRPRAALGREVTSCHPPRIQTMVESILADLRSGKRDKVEVWTEKASKTLLVSYMAVRDPEGRYLGCMELVQDMSFAKQRFAGQ